jgi:hypothetical protein
MPKLHEYDNKPGYYIVAHPSDAGFTTYQVNEIAAEGIEDLGYKGGDDISWDVINTFRDLGHIYTNSSGPGEAEPGDSGEIDKLSFEQKKKLAAYVITNEDHSDEKKVEIISSIFTLEEWVEYVEEFGQSNHINLPEEIEKLIDNRLVDINFEETKKALYKNEELLLSVSEFYTHPWEIKTIGYNPDIWYSFETDELDNVMITDCRPFDDPNCFSEPPGDTSEVDFEFVSMSVPNDTVLYVRDNHIIPPEDGRSYLPEEDEQWHIHIKNLFRLYITTRDFFNDFDGYDITEPNPEPVREL